MSVIFRYQRMKSQILGEIKRPVARVFIRSGDGDYIEFHPYIDSGADMTLLPYSFGLMLGFSQETGNIKELQGVRGIGLPVIIKKLNMRIGTTEFECRLAWALINDVPPLLGRLDVFDRFEIKFMEKEEKIVFEEF